MLLTDQIVPKFADLCSYCANKVPLLCVPRLFLKQLKEQKAKVSSCKKRPDNTEDKNAIENYGVLTRNIAIITFGECI